MKRWPVSFLEKFLSESAIVPYGMCNAYQSRSQVLNHYFMSQILFINGTVILPDRLLPNAEVECCESRIVFVGKKRKRSPKDAHR